VSASLLAFSFSLCADGLSSDKSEEEGDAGGDALTGDCRTVGTHAKPCLLLGSLF
jgi:hypothetical protein